MKSSSQGKDPFPELLIFPPDIFWNTNVSRGGLLGNELVHESDQIGLVTLVHMLTIIQNFYSPSFTTTAALGFPNGPTQGHLEHKQTHVCITGSDALHRY